METVQLPGDVELGETGEVRLFIGLPLPPHIVDAVRVVQADLRKASGRAVRWVAPETLHITLTFLGEVPRWVVQDIPDALAPAFEAARSLKIKVDSVGAFPGWGKPKVIHLTLGGDINGLNAIRKRAGAGLRDLGFPLDPRPFVPHLTMGRIRAGADASSIDRMRSAAQKLTLPDVKAELSEIVLYRSVLAPESPDHFVIESWPLATSTSPAQATSQTER